MVGFGAVIGVPCCELVSNGGSRMGGGEPQMCALRTQFVAQATPIFIIYSLFFKSGRSMIAPTFICFSRAIIDRPHILNAVCLLLRPYTAFLYKTPFSGGGWRLCSAFRYHTFPLCGTALYRRPASKI